LKKSFITDNEDGDTGEITPTLEHLTDHVNHGHKAVFINEPKLADFKRVLQLEGYQAEFAGGVLIVNDTVALRRVSNCQI
jgi:hypothetical protein